MLNKITSIYFLEKLFSYIQKKTLLNLIIYNKNLQKKLNISIESYKKYSYQIEIEIIPDLKSLKKDDLANEFIYINNKDNNKFYHIFFDERKKESKRNYLKRKEKISKIKVLIDMEVNTIAELFCESHCVKEIKFIKFNRKDLTDYSNMFFNCTNLISLDISKLKTENVTNMAGMFQGCSKLLKLNVSNFKTENVIKIECMFQDCSSLKELDLSNFKTDKVEVMNTIFEGCSSLKKLDISNFNTEKVEDMTAMFSNCSKIENLNLSNFKTDKVNKICKIIIQTI